MPWGIIVSITHKPQAASSGTISRTGKALISLNGMQS